MALNILTKHQRDFLQAINKIEFFRKNFYLTGGTALAAFYIQRRYSENLDFFSEKEIDLLNLNISLNRVKKDLQISKIDFQQSFNRNIFFCYFKKKILKTEFTFFPFSRIEKGGMRESIEIDSIIDIAVNKLFTIYQRTHARDYIDLYCICREKGFVVGDLIKKAKIKFDWHIDPIQLGTQFVKVREAKDYPRMIQKLPAERWQKFFILEAGKLKKEILK